jgi:hypothetical protein
MDRYSLGISFTRQMARAVVYNVDQSVVENHIVVPYTNLTNEISNLLSVIDQLFLELSKCAPLKQVAMIKVSGPEDLGVCSSDKFYKSLMTFSAYAESLEQHFKDGFTSPSILRPHNNNANFAKIWTDNFPHEFKLPQNALLFSLKNFISASPETWRNTTNIQFLSSFVTSILAGKRAPVDSSCAKISGLQGVENKWSETNTNWVSFDLKSKLDDIKNSYENFSYVSSYFVEKYGVYREARILTASGNSAACARGAGGIVYLDTDDKFQLGAVVNNVPMGNGSFYINGIVPGQSLCIVASVFDLLLSLSPAISIDVDAMKNLYSATLLKLPITQPIKQTSLIVSQLAEIKSNSKPFDKIFVTGDLSENVVFLQACADLFSAEIIAFDKSVCGAAIGNALSAARKIKESDYETIMKSYFEATPSKRFTPTNEGLSQMLSQLIAYSNL